MQVGGAVGVGACVRVQNCSGLCMPVAYVEVEVIDNVPEEKESEL